MLSLLTICLLAGFIGSILAGMLGVGIGIITVPLLTFILPHYGIPADLAIHVALATSLAAISLNSINAIISHHKRGNITWIIFKKIIFFSISGAFIGALLADYLASRYLEIIYGVFLLLIAMYMFFKQSALTEANDAANLSSSIMAIGGSSIGLVASLIGSGGGVLLVPFLRALQVNMRYAVGTSSLIALPASFIGAVTYAYLGLAKLPLASSTIGYIHWPALLAIAAAGIIGAPIGTRLTTILPTVILQRLFAVCMLIIGMKMLI
jgi:uncharacterized membrane protein YfcA